MSCKSNIINEVRLWERKVYYRLFFCYRRSTAYLLDGLSWNMANWGSHFFPFYESRVVWLNRFRMVISLVRHYIMRQQTWIGISSAIRFECRFSIVSCKGSIGQIPCNQLKCLNPSSSLLDLFALFLYFRIKLCWYLFSCAVWLYYFWFACIVMRLRLRFCMVRFFILIKLIVLCARFWYLLTLTLRILALNLWNILNQILLFRFLYVYFRLKRNFFYFLIISILRVVPGKDFIHARKGLSRNGRNTKANIFKMSHCY